MLEGENWTAASDSSALQRARWWRCFTQNAGSIYAKRPFERAQQVLRTSLTTPPRGAANRPVLSPSMSCAEVTFNYLTPARSSSRK